MGRIGDSAIVGSGYYAENDSGAAVATGNGDVIMKACISKRACEIMADKPAQDAADTAISELGELDDGRGGIITLDPRGGIGMAFNRGNDPRMEV